MKRSVVTPSFTLPSLSHYYSIPVDTETVVLPKVVDSEKVAYTPWEQVRKNVCTGVKLMFSFGDLYDRLIVFLHISITKVRSTIFVFNSVGFGGSLCFKSVYLKSSYFVNSVYSYSFLLNRRFKSLSTKSFPLNPYRFFVYFSTGYSYQYSLYFYSWFYSMGICGILLPIVLFRLSWFRTVPKSYPSREYVTTIFPHFVVLVKPFTKPWRITSSCTWAGHWVIKVRILNVYFLLLCKMFLYTYL